MNQKHWLALCLLITLSVLGNDPTRSRLGIETSHLQLKTQDQWTVTVTLWQPDLADAEITTAVVLVHDIGGDRHQWKALASRLCHDGFLVCALDLRGHGDSTQKRKTSFSWMNLSKAEWQKATEDIKAACDRVTQHHHADIRRVVLVGSRLGAHLCSQMTTQNLEGLVGVALLSPDDQVHRVSCEKDFKDLPVLLAYDTQDQASQEASRTVQGQKIETAVSEDEALMRGVELLSDSSILNRLHEFIKKLHDL